MNIEFKEWLDYSSKEKEELLRFWWFHFGIPVTKMEDFQEFLTIVEGDPDDTWYTAVLCFYYGVGNEYMLTAIKDGSLETLLAASLVTRAKVISSSELAKRELLQAERFLLATIVKEYNREQIQRKQQLDVHPHNVIDISKHRK